MDERGAATVWMLTIGVAAIVLFGGLLYDGGQALNMRARVDDAALTIARAASLDTGVDDSGSVAIDERAASERAAQVAAQFPDITWTLVFDGSAAHVTATGSYSPRLLNAIGIGELSHTTTQTANSLFGGTTP